MGVMIERVALVVEVVEDEEEVAEAEEEALVVVDVVLGVDEPTSQPTSR